jgi:hypothetical protein
MENIKSPSEFLEQYGIQMQKTALICYIDEVMKQPSLSFIMNEYAKYVSDIKIENLKEENDIK